MRFRGLSTGESTMKTELPTWIKIAVIALALVAFFTVFHWYESLSPDPAVKTEIESYLPPGMTFEDIQFDLWWFSIAWTAYVIIMALLICWFLRNEP